MSRALTIFLLLVTSLSCQDDKIDSQATSCSYPYGELRRAEFVSNLPATVILVKAGTLKGNFQIVPSDGTDSDGSDRVPLGICNLPQAFLQDSLKVHVSGYLITSSQLERIQIAVLPFEITEARKRN